MSIRSSLERVEERSKRKKSFENLKLAYDVLEADKFLKNPQSSGLKQRIHQREYTVDKVKTIFKLYSMSQKRIINLYALRDFFFNIGFNTDVMMSDTFKSDISLVYNVGGYVIPFWREFVVLLFKKRSPYRKLLLSTLSPGRSRLHCRCYHDVDGSWYITSHIDHANWFNILDIFGIFKSHAVKGAGDYILGTTLLKDTLEKAFKRYREGKDIYVDVGRKYLELIKEIK